MVIRKSNGAPAISKITRASRRFLSQLLRCFCWCLGESISVPFPSSSFFSPPCPIDPDNLPIYIREYQPITILTYSTHREWNSIRGIKERGVQIRVYETSCAVSQPGSLGKIRHLPGMLHFDFTSTSASGKVRLRCVLIREIR